MLFANLFNSHHHLHRVQAIQAQVVRKVCVRLDLEKAHTISNTILSPIPIVPPSPFLSRIGGGDTGFTYIRRVIDLRRPQNVSKPLTFCLSRPHLTHTHTLSNPCSSVEMRAYTSSLVSAPADE